MRIRRAGVSDGCWGVGLRELPWLTALLLFLPTGSSAQTPIVCGQTINGTISVIGEDDTYTFDAIAGNAVQISVARTSGTLAPAIVLNGR